MEELATIAEMRRAVARARAEGRRVALVPTMGFLHEGHLRLVDEACRRADCVAMSIFVNPLQFGPSEDLSRYPRDIEGDRAKAAARRVDLLFAPVADEMYPRPTEIAIEAARLAARWEGAARPGHFAGVLTVVAKLFNIVQPDVAVFGQKDFQQALVVRAMARELSFPVDVVVAPTVREADGLALSSRNVYLAPAERADALGLVRSLRAAAAAFGAGERRGAVLADAGRAALALVPSLVVDYFAVVDPDTLDAADVADERSHAIVAARVGRTRLIDNMRLAAPA
jgi:pantoate--beta-alanine ligase